MPVKFVATSFRQTHTLHIRSNFINQKIIALTIMVPKDLLSAIVILQLAMDISANYWPNFKPSCTALPYCLDCVTACKAGSVKRLVSVPLVCTVVLVSKIVTSIRAWYRSKFCALTSSCQQLWPPESFLTINSGMTFHRPFTHLDTLNFHTLLNHSLILPHHIRMTLIFGPSCLCENLDIVIRIGLPNTPNLYRSFQ